MHIFRRWPLREVLACYTARRQEHALEAYRFEVLKYVIQKGYVRGRLERPPVPGILKEAKRDG